MKMHKILTLALTTSLLSLTTALHAQPADLLDQTLGEDKKPPATRPAPPKVDPVNPDAAKAVDTEDLVSKLTGGEENAAAGAEKMLNELLERMGSSAQRLHDKDPGLVTQETQRRIVLNLDTLIEIAKKNSSSSSSSSSSGQKPGQKREKNPGQGNGQMPGQNSQGGNTAAGMSTLPPGDAKPFESNGQNINEKGREWGNLPDRERDLVVHGSKEEALPAYRDMVQKYYQALSDLGKTTRDNR